jgi:hypothetical protein
MSGIFSSPKAPAAPDTAGTITAQAKANQINQLTPEGNQFYGTIDPVTGEFIANEGNTTLKIEQTPFQQELQQGGQGISLALLNSLQQGGAGNLSGVRTASDIEAGLPSLSQDFSGDARQAQQANYEANLAQLQPQFDRQRQQIEQRLADQGLPIGSKAYQEELDRLERSQGNQLQQLSQSSVQAGNARSNELASLLAQQQAQQFNTQSGLQNQENQARASQFGELGSLLGFANPFTQFQTTGVDAAGIINQGYANQLGAFNANQQGQQGNMAALGQLGGMGASFLMSDYRLKENIRPLGKENGFNIYEFSYKGDDTRYKGVMAQEVKKVRPDAVTVKDGFLAVCYEMLGLKMEKVCQ